MKKMVQIIGIVFVFLFLSCVDYVVGADGTVEDSTTGLGIESVLISWSFVDSPIKLGHLGESIEDGTFIISSMVPRDWQVLDYMLTFSKVGYVEYTKTYNAGIWYVGTVQLVKEAK